MGRHARRGRRAQQCEERSSLSQQYLSGLESGVSNPAVVTLMWIAGEPGADIVALLNGPDGERSGAEGVEAPIEIEPGFQPGLTTACSPLRRG